LTVIFYKDLTKGGGLTDATINADDVAAKFVVRPATINPAVETFTFDITDLSNNGASIAIMWDKTLVKVPFTYKTDEAVMVNIKQKWQVRQVMTILRLQDTILKVVKILSKPSNGLRNQLI
jgi:hypothetical protein